ncbi:MAG: hypothetical protein M3256_05280 [Actinomycetota bacterium]|nr:hypothetical protein [Actinomycetota bacterium]
MNRVFGRRPVAASVVVIVLLVYVLFLPRVVPIQTLLTVSVAIMIALFLLVGLWLLLTARIPGWIPSRQVRTSLSVRLTGFVFVLLAGELVLAETNFLFHWHALWPLDAITVITVIAVAVAAVSGVRNGRHQQRPL